MRTIIKVEILNISNIIHEWSLIYGIREQEN